jgi:hypothetical protein
MISPPRHLLFPVFKRLQQSKMAATTEPSPLDGFYEARPAKRANVRALEEQLRALDKQRDVLRVALADATLAMPEVPWWTNPTPEQQAAWLAALEARIARRAERRAWEREWCGLIQPGPWDEDLDKHMGETITWDLGDGYTGQLYRNRDGGWNYYITVPEGHKLWGKSYEDRDLPCYFTYSAHAHCRGVAGGGWTFGGCHDGESGAVVPKDHYRTYRADNHFSGERPRRLIMLPSFEPVPFLTAEKVQEQVMTIKKKLMPADLLAAQEAREAAERAAAEAKWEAEHQALIARLKEEQKEAERAAKAKMSWADIVKSKK